MEFLIGLIILVLDIWAIYKIVTSGASGLAKVIWCLVIIVLPVIGLIIWLPNVAQAHLRSKYLG
jgi:hypothetical protein